MGNVKPRDMVKCTKPSGEPHWSKGHLPCFACFRLSHVSIGGKPSKVPCDLKAMEVRKLHFTHNRIILQVNMIYGWELVVVYATLSMFHKCLVDTWRNWCRGLINIHSISMHWGPTRFGMPRGTKMSLALIEQNRLLIIYFQPLPPSIHHKWKEVLEVNFHAKQPMEVHRGPTSYEKFHCFKVRMDRLVGKGAGES